MTSAQNIIGRWSFFDKPRRGIMTSGDSKLIGTLVATSGDHDEFLFVVDNTIFEIKIPSRDWTFTGFVVVPREAGSYATWLDHLGNRFYAVRNDVEWVDDTGDFRTDEELDGFAQDSSTYFQILVPAENNTI